MSLFSLLIADLSLFKTFLSNRTYLGIKRMVEIEYLCLILHPRKVKNGHYMVFWHHGDTGFKATQGERHL
jgi:hypothetical protein